MKISTICWNNKQIKLLKKTLKYSIPYLTIHCKCDKIVLSGTFVHDKCRRFKMRHKDPELMKKIYEYAEDYYFSEGYSPSTSEIANAMGIARTTAYNYLVAMDKLSMVDYDGKLIATEKIRKTGAVNHGVKIYDNAIPCGELETIESSVSEYVDLPASIFGNGELFILRTRGESMIDAGIEPGDLVVVEKKRTANDGDIVVALGNDTDSSLKRLIKKNNMYVLHPENKNMDDIITEHLEIQGVAKFIIKQI